MKLQFSKRGEDRAKQKFTEIVSTFEKMSAKSAAPVITNMSDAEAIQILTSLKPDKSSVNFRENVPRRCGKIYDDDDEIVR